MAGTRTRLDIDLRRSQLVEIGMELFRLHGIRLLAGLDAVVPFFESRASTFEPASVRSVYPLGHVRLAF